MPNWCNGSVVVRGKPDDVEGFCKLFIFDGEFDGGEKKAPYFARSFANDNWETFKADYLGGNEANFGVNFAWSGWTCLIEGYPQRSEDCITLEDAGKIFNVKVEILTEEPAMGFEEKITADENGVIYKSFDMPEFKCEKCGEVCMFGSYQDTEEQECYHCDNYGEFKAIEVIR